MHVSINGPPVEQCQKVVECVVVKWKTAKNRKKSKKNAQANVKESQNFEEKSKEAKTITSTNN